MPMLGKLSGQESAELAAHVAGLTKAGLPLAGGLRALAGELPRGRLARAVARLAAILQEGTPLDEALARPEVRLPAHVRGLIMAGVRSGRLPRMLEEFVELWSRRSSSCAAALSSACCIPPLSWCWRPA